MGETRSAPMLARGFAGLLVAALTFWALPGGVQAAAPPINPQLTFVRTYQGMVAVLCARPDLKRIEVLVDGSPFATFSQPRNGDSCGPDGRGVNYTLMIDNRAIEAYPGHRSVAVRVTGGDDLVQHVGGTVFLAAGAIVVDISVVEWVGSQVHVRGWALDPDAAHPLQVTFSGVDRRGQRQETTVTASNWVQEVADRYPGYGGAYGFDVMLPRLDWVKVTVDNLYGYESVSRDFRPPNQPTFAHMDPVAVEGRRITISGSAYDSDGPTTVALGLNGRLAAVLAIGDRLEPPTSAQPWSFSVPVDPGTFDVCAQYGDYPSNVFSAPECQQVVVK